MTFALPLTANARLPGPLATQRARQAALEDLMAAGWPTRRRELWRYTDLEPLAAAALNVTPAAADSTTIAAAARLLASAGLGDPARQLVLLDGQRQPGLGADSVEGLEISTPESVWGSSESRFATVIAATLHPLATLNTAYTQNGLWLRVPAGSVVAGAVHVVMVASARAALAAQPRIVIDAEPGAQLTVVQHFIDCEPAGESGWVNAVTQVNQAEGSRVVLYRFQHHGRERTHTSLLSVELGANAEFCAGYFDLGGRLVRNDVHVRLAGTGARTELTGVFLVGAGQHVDNHTTVDHATGETVSSEDFRGIVANRGRGVFNGKVVVQKGSQRIEASQTNDNLLLGEHAEVDTKPELEIYANDVKCRHGATVGELDAEQLFYLRTRGLDAEAARDTLTTAFAAVILDRIRDETIRAHALETVAARLATLTER